MAPQRGHSHGGDCALPDVGAGVRHGERDRTGRNPPGDRPAGDLHLHWLCHHWWRIPYCE